jgi:ABC-2 type transport system permease protein
VRRTIRAAALIAANDLRRRLRNRAFLLQAFVGPLVMSVLISLAFGSGLGFDLEIGFVAEDRSGLAAELQRRFVDTESEGVTFVAFDDLDAAAAAVSDGDVGAAIVVPRGFQESLAGPDPEPIGMVVDNDQSELYGAVARAVAEGIVARINAGRLATATLLADGRPAPEVAELAETELPIEIRRRAAGGEVSPAASVGPGIGLLFLFLSVAIVARSLFEEKRLRVLDRVRAAPVSMGAVLLGKGIGVVVLSSVTMGVLWLATSVLLGASWGDPVAVSAIVLAASIAVAGIAAFIAGTVRSERSADLYATMVAFVLGILGGSLVPLSELPPGLLRLTLLTPNGWALRGFAELSAGDGTVVDVLPHIGVLLLWGIVAGGIGRWLLPRRLGTR